MAEKWTEARLQAWYALHGPERGREPIMRSQSVPVGTDARGDPVYRTEQVEVGEIITAQDGATIRILRLPESGQPGKADYEVSGHMDPPPKETPQRTPEQVRSDTALATQREEETKRKTLEDNERSWNQSDPRGSGIPETHLERAAREAKIEQERRAEQQRQEIQRKADAEAAAKRAEDAKDREERARQANQSAQIQREQLEETKRQNEASRNKPDFLSTADSKNQNITFYNPQTGQIESAINPNYDAIKAAAEERRAELASQIADRQISLEEAKQSYTQWFDTNVRVPLMQSQEARARAEERRQALEAEERRRQFASTFKLQKAQLGQQAGEAAMQAEQSLLPYRSGPTWGADISSAINSLAGGGSMNANAAAGIKFSDSSFAFNAPNFKQIAKEAAKAALSGLTDYRPSDDEFAVGDYSGVPSVNMSGAPAYQYTPAALPAPSPGAALPPE